MNWILHFIPKLKVECERYMKRTKKGLPTLECRYGLDMAAETTHHLGSDFLWRSSDSVVLSLLSGMGVILPNLSDNAAILGTDIVLLPLSNGADDF